MALHQTDPWLICRLSVSQDETERRLRAKALMLSLGWPLIERHQRAGEMYFCSSDMIMPHVRQLQPCCRHQTFSFWLRLEINTEIQLETRKAVKKHSPAPGSSCSRYSGLHPKQPRACSRSRGGSRWAGLLFYPFISQKLLELKNKFTITCSPVVIQGYHSSLPYDEGLLVLIFGRSKVSPESATSLIIYVLFMFFSPLATFSK